MTTNRIRLTADRDCVWEVLTDARAYAYWVVGSKRVRWVEADWPQPGSAFHHTVGWGPIEDNDSTMVLEIEPMSRLVLEARVWPVGTARVAFTLRAADGGTEMTMVEQPSRGPAARFDNRLVQALIRVRNAVGLRRFRRLVAERGRRRG